MRRFSPPWMVFIASCFCLLMFLGSRGLNEPDEGRFAEASREMSLQSSWLIPHLAGVPHLQKPPLIFWITAISIKYFGVNEWAARLPSAMAALGIIWLTMHLSGLLLGPSVQWKSGLILLSSGLFFSMARIITTDMLLTFWITGAVVAFVHYTRRGSISALILFYVCLGLGFLTKGPMAYLVPFSAVIPWVLACRHEKRPPGWLWHWIPGLLLAVIISVSWFFLLFREHPGLLEYYYRNEFVDRIASDVHHRSKPFWFYTLVMIGGLLPWSMMLPRIIGDLWKRRRDPRMPEFWLFSGWLLIPWLVLHLITSKLPTYILPLFPPLAIVCAYYWNRLEHRWNIEVRLITALFAIIVAALPRVIWQIWKDHGNAPPIQPVFFLAAFVISAGWMFHYIKAASKPSRYSLLTGVATMMLASLLLISSQAEELLQSRNRSLLPAVDEIRRAQAEFPDAKLFALNIRKYSLEYYLQKPIIRTLKDIETTLPIPEDLKSMYVADPFDYLRENDTSEYLLMIPHYFLPDPLPPDWQIIFDKPVMVIVHRAGLSISMKDDK